MYFTILYDLKSRVQIKTFLCFMKHSKLFSLTLVMHYPDLFGYIVYCRISTVSIQNVLYIGWVPISIIIAYYYNIIVICTIILQISY